MVKNKPRIVKSYEKLSYEVLEQLKLVYPRGFTKHLISFTDREGLKKKGLPFETEEFYFLIRMSEERAMAIIEEDDDYDDSGKLKSSVKEEYEDKYEDEDFLNELNDNEDNDLGIEEADDED